VIRTDLSGNVLWDRTYGGSSGDQGVSVHETLDGGYIVGGTTYSYGAGESDIYMIKINAAGHPLWTRTFGGPRRELCSTVLPTEDKGYIIIGTSYSFDAFPCIYIVKTDEHGDLTWEMTYGGTEGAAAGSGQQIRDGGYIVVGYTLSTGPGFEDVLLLKLDDKGDADWKQTYGGWTNDIGYSVQQTGDDGFIIAGVTSSFSPHVQVYAIKTDEQGKVADSFGDPGGDITLDFGLSAMPNPFVRSARIPGREGDKFMLYDVSGRLVREYRGDEIGGDLSPGVYFLRDSRPGSEPLRIVKVP